MTEVKPKDGKPNKGYEGKPKFKIQANAVSVMIDVKTRPTGDAAHPWEAARARWMEV